MMASERRPLSSGRVRFRDHQGEVTGFSDDDDDESAPFSHGLDLSLSPRARAPPGEEADSRRKTKGGTGGRSGGATAKPKLLKQSSSEVSEGLIRVEYVVGLNMLLLCGGGWCV
jgi:hypothetical protein